MAVQRVDDAAVADRAAPEMWARSCVENLVGIPVSETAETPQFT